MRRFFYLNFVLWSKNIGLYIFYIVLNVILSERAKKILSYYQLNDIEEVRIIAGAPLSVTVKGTIHNSTTIMTLEDVEYTLSRVSRNSLYAVNDMIIRGYISYDGGIRVGVAGEFVYVDGKVRTIKNINSLVIRIPHCRYGVSDKFIDIVYDKKVKSTLFIGAPLSGKTTILRELARVLSSEKKVKVVIIDEKNELSASYNGKVGLDVGNSIVCVGAARSHGVENAIRNLSPQLIITDEIYGVDDTNCIKRCIQSGISVITSMHGRSVQGSGFEGLFENYIGLSSNPIGGIEWIEENYA